MLATLKVPPQQSNCAPGKMAAGLLKGSKQAPRPSLVFPASRPNKLAYVPVFGGYVPGFGASVPPQPAPAAPVEIPGMAYASNRPVDGVRGTQSRAAADRDRPVRPAPLAAMQEEDEDINHGAWNYEAWVAEQRDQVSDDMSACCSSHAVAGMCPI